MIETLLDVLIVVLFLIVGVCFVASPLLAAGIL